MKLKNCPVCDGDNIIQYEVGLVRHSLVNDEWAFTDFPNCGLECANCGHYIEGVDFECASKEWNENSGSIVEHRLWKLHLGGRRK